MKGKKKQNLSASELLRKLKAEPLYRSFVIENVDEEARTVSLSFSSEYPVMRWFGYEILDHQSSSVRMNRFENGASVLVNHDWNDLVGVIEEARIESKQGKAVVRFGESERAEEIWKDVKSGIRKHISIGYIPHSMRLEKDEEDTQTYRVTDWEPFELSFVTVPADPSVGVGRSLESLSENYLLKLRDMGVLPSGAENENEKRSKTSMKEKILRDASGRLVRANVDDKGAIIEVLEVLEDANTERGLGVEAEQERIRSILDLAETYKNRGVSPNDFLRDKSKTAADYQRALLDAGAKNGGGEGRRSGTPTAADNPDIGLSEKEVRQYSFVNVLRYLSQPTNEKYREAAAFEIEASEAASEKMKREAQGIIVPNDVLRAAGPIASTGSGAKLIGTEHLSGSFIDILSNASAVLPHVTTLTGLTGNVVIPTQEGGATGYWLGEDTDTTLSEVTFGERALNNRTCGALVEITRKMLQQGTPDVEMLVRNDLARALGLTIDKAALYGTGANGQPTGLINITGVNAVNFAAENPTFAEVVAMETAIKASNADVSSLLYLMNAAGRGHCKTTQKFSGSNGATIWEPGNTVNGYGTGVSNQIDAGNYFFGAWAEMLVGMWGGLDLTIDPYTHSSKGRLRVVAFQDVDVTVRHAASFAVGKKPAV